MGLKGRNIIHIWLLCLLVCFPALAHASERPLRVAFISPSTKARPFWDDYVSFMEVAADSLGIDLRVDMADNRYDVTDRIRRVVYGPDKPDYLVCIYQADSSILGLKITTEAGVKTLFVNTAVMAQDQSQAGQPREMFPLWIGHIYPDDLAAGRQLAERLIRQAKELEMRGPDGKVHLLGIGGNLLATSSIFRKEGLDIAVREHSDAALDRFVLGYWKRDVSAEKTRELLDLHPEARVIWAINDFTALGVMDAIEEKGMVPGRDILTGGIDWTPECIQQVREGRMVASIGGHFMEGAWALIMLLDYHNGHDFADPDPTLRSEMRVIDRETLDTYLPIVDRENWKRIDFRRFSKTYNPDLTKYDFSPDAVVRQLARH